MNKNLQMSYYLAGAILARETKNDVSFYQQFQDKIISETKLNWPKAKRRLKNLPEPMHAPIQGKN